MALTVLCDCDGVIVNLLDEWLAAYHDVGGERLSPSDISEYGWENFVANKELFLQVLRSGGIFASAKPMPGALAGLASLRAEHDVTLVTTVFGSRAMDNRRGWLWRYVRPDIETPDIIFTGKKHLVWGDVIVEDSPKNMAAWLAAHPHGQGFLIDHFYNQQFSHPRCLRVGSLLEVVDYLREYPHAAAG